MKKKIIVACGGAVATSTVALERIKEITKEANIEVELIQCRVTEISMYSDGADLIVTTSKVTQEYNVPLVHGIAFVSGIGEEKLIEKVLEILSK